MLKRCHKKKILNDKGQAFFELVLFLPIFIVLFFFFIAIGNAINGSINQQTTLRGYYYYYLKGNSNAPSRRDVIATTTATVELMTLVWQSRAQGEVPIASCYRLTSFFGEIQEGESCERANFDGAMTQFIRVYTAYGHCGETYRTVGAGGGHFAQRGVFAGCRNE